MLLEPSSTRYDASRAARISAIVRLIVHGRAATNLAETIPSCQSTRRALRKLDMPFQPRRWCAGKTGSQCQIAPRTVARDSDHASMRGASHRSELRFRNILRRTGTPVARCGPLATLAVPNCGLGVEPQRAALTFGKAKNIRSRLSIARDWICNSLIHRESVSATQLLHHLFLRHPQPVNLRENLPGRQKV